MSAMTTQLDGIQCIDELEIENRRVFIRVDFNVPFDKKTGEITDADRIQRAIPTIAHALERGARVILGSHRGRPKGTAVDSLSLEPCAAKLSELGGWEVFLPDDCLSDAAVKVIGELRAGQLCLWENLRFHPGEESNDEGFARDLSDLFDVYVNDAFGAAHRAHASVSALPKLIPERGMGFLLRDELKSLARLLEQPQKPFVAVLGGAKVSDKIGVIERLIVKSDALCIGGAMANTFAAATGREMAESLLQADGLPLARTLIEKARDAGTKLLLPSDFVVADSADANSGTVAVGGLTSGSMALDIGPKTVESFSAEIAAAKTVFWNGPMGLFENPAFAAGSTGIAHALAETEAFSVVGGGDSAAAVRAAGDNLASQLDFISTGGGAALELIEGKQLPGVEALRTTPRPIDPAEQLPE